MKNIVRNLLECAINCDDFSIRKQLEEEIKELIETFELTINCPSDWKCIRLELLNEYSKDEYVLNLLD